MAKLSFSVNGNPVDFFSCKRGVQQGDPLSPLLFCIEEDVLSKGISYLVDCGLLTIMFGPRGFRSTSHVLYVDDIMVFCKGTRKSLEALMSLFHSYGQASGQLLGLDKCRFYSKNLSSATVASIATTLALLLGIFLSPTLASLYLLVGQKKFTWSQLQTELKLKLSSWKGSILSIMGQVQLIQSVIHGMLIYIFHVYSWPLSLLKHLEQCIKNFLWSGDIHVHRVVTVAWKTVCSVFSPICHGGLGL